MLVWHTIQWLFPDLRGLVSLSLLWTALQRMLLPLELCKLVYSSYKLDRCQRTFKFLLDISRLSPEKDCNSLYSEHQVLCSATGGFSSFLIFDTEANPYDLIFYFAFIESRERLHIFLHWLLFLWIVGHLMLWFGVMSLWTQSCLDVSLSARFLSVLRHSSAGSVLVF